MAPEVGLEKNLGAMSIFQASRIIAAIALFLALFEMPDDYYKALRLVVVAASVLEIWQLQKGEESQNAKTAWTLLLSGVAIMFNPILPLDLEREQWAAFDLLGAGVFLWRALPDLKEWLEKFRTSETYRPLEITSTIPPIPQEEDPEDLSRAKTAATVILLFMSVFIIGLIAWLIFVSVGHDEKAMSEQDYDRYQSYVKQANDDEKKLLESQSIAKPEPEIKAPLPAAISDGVEVRQAIPLTYTVQKGDNPYSIAKKLRVSYNDLLSVNGIYDATKIQPGQTLKVPTE